MKKTTNKQLIKMGVTQEQILGIVSETLTELFGGNINLIGDIRLDGCEDYTTLYFQDHKNRDWSVYFENGENMENLYVESTKNKNYDIEQNVNTFKSIHAVINFIERKL